ncbi:MAG: hypothetical protein ACI9YE_000454 [Psychroserpens sp.]|jgi:hypothetical protein
MPSKETKLPKLPAGCYYYVNEGNAVLNYRYTTKNPNGGDAIILKQGPVSLVDFKVTIND